MRRGVRVELGPITSRAVRVTSQPKILAPQDGVTLINPYTREVNRVTAAQAAAVQAQATMSRRLGRKQSIPRKRGA